VTGYSDAAIADEDFRPARSAVGGIISRLESRNWYKQNAAVGEIAKDVVAIASKNDLFVLGRNVYQAACGDANSAKEYLRDLKSELGRLPDVASFHLLNGMLFEIYFDSKGLKRKRAKTGQFEDVLAMEEERDHAPSFDFIRKKLGPYLGELFYVPGSRTEVCVDVRVDRAIGEPAVAEVDFEGENVMYDSTGEGYFELSDDLALKRTTRDAFKLELSEALITPSFRLRVVYTGRPIAGDELIRPWELNLKRIAPK
jgi:hypothetical protein